MIPFLTTFTTAMHKYLGRVLYIVTSSLETLCLIILFFNLGWLYLWDHSADHNQLITTPTPYKTLIFKTISCCCLLLISDIAYLEKNLTGFSSGVENSVQWKEISIPCPRKVIANSDGKVDFQCHSLYRKLYTKLNWKLDFVPCDRFVQMT